MKTVIKLLIAAVVLFACFNVGKALMDEYRFEDAVHDRLLFDSQMTDREIVDMVMRTAADFDVPIDASGVDITTRGPDVVVTMTYTTSIPIIPGIIEKEWTFTPSASTKILVGRRRTPK